jgi:hypothetical protein
VAGAAVQNAKQQNNIHDVNNNVGDEMGPSSEPEELDIE